MQDPTQQTPDQYQGMNPTTAGILAQLDPNSSFSKTYNQAQQASQPTDPSATAAGAQQQPPQSDGGNWLTKLIPTVASIGGGLLGTLADPFTMGAGTFLGAGAGSALGKSIENALEGKQTTAGDLLTSGGEGLLGAGIGKAGEGVLKLAGGALSGIGAKGIAGAESAAKAATDAEAAATSNAAAKNVVALYGKNAAEGVDNNFNRAQDFTNSLGHNIANDPVTAHSDLTNMVEALGNARTEALNNAGHINTAGVVDEAGNVASPSVHDILMDSFNHTTPNGNTVDLSQQMGGLGTIANNVGANSPARFVASLAPKSGNTDASALLNNVKTDLAPLFKDGSYDAAGNVPGTAVQDSLSAVNNRLKDAYNEMDAAGRDASTAGNLSAVRAKVSYLSNVKSGLENMLYNRPEFSSALGDATSKEGGLIDTLNGLGDSGQKLATQLENVNPTTGGQDFNKVFGNVLNARDVVEPAAAKFSSPTSQFAQNENANAIKMAKDGSLAPNMPNGVDANGNPIVDAAANHSHPIIAGAGKLIQAANNGGMGSKAAVNLGTTLSRIAPIAGLTTGETLANAGNYTPDAVPTGQFNTGQQPQNGVSTMNGETPIQHAMNIAQIGLENPYTAANYLPLLQQLTGQQQQAHTAAATLQSLENGFGAAGGGQGMVGGLLSKLGGALTGNQVSGYEAQRQQAMDVLSKLGIPLSAIPDVTSTNGAAQGQFANAQNIINSINGGQ